ncbi:hypothetical protein C1646_777443, partial [Rhizophagus diaphanus]
TGYTSCTQQAIEDLDNSLTIRDTWESIYSIVFTLYQISEAVPSTNSDNSSESFDFPDNFQPLLHDLHIANPLTPGLLFTDEDLHLENLFGIEPLGLLFTKEDLNLEFLFRDPEPLELLHNNENLHLEFLFGKSEPAGLLFSDEDLNLEFLFNEPEEPNMAMAGGGPEAGRFNPNALLNVLNNLTNALGAAGNMHNVMNNLNAILTANNNTLQNKGTYIYQSVAGNSLIAWAGAMNNNTFEHVFKQKFCTPALLELWFTELDQRQQQPEESRVNDDAFVYPDNVQARIFVSELLLELYMAVKPFGDQTLQSAVDRAHACELTLKEKRAKSMNYAATSHVTGITELVNIVSILVTQVDELTKRVETQAGRFKNANRNGQNAGERYPTRNPTQNRSVTCYTCG